MGPITRNMPWCNPGTPNSRFIGTNRTNWDEPDRLEDTVTKRESIVAVLVAHEVDPDQVVTTDSGPRTAYDVMEAHVMAGMDEIEEGTT